MSPIKPRMTFAIMNDGEIDIKQLTDIEDQPPGVQKRMVPVVILPKTDYNNLRRVLSVFVTTKLLNVLMPIME